MYLRLVLVCVISLQTSGNKIIYAGESYLERFFEENGGGLPHTIRAFIDGKELQNKTLSSGKLNNALVIHCHSAEFYRISICEAFLRA